MFLQPTMRLTCGCLFLEVLVKIGINIDVNIVLNCPNFAIPHKRVLFLPNKNEIDSPYEKQYRDFSKTGN